MNDGIKEKQMNKINKETYLEHLKNYVKLFDGFNTNKIYKPLALKTLKTYRNWVAIDVSDLLIEKVENNLQLFIDLSLGFASLYMLIEMIINNYNVEQNSENFMRCARELKIV